MRKAILKRIKITKNGKMLRRRRGQNHFNAKETRKAQLKQKKMAQCGKTACKKIKNYLR